MIAFYHNKEILFSQSRIDVKFIPHMGSVVVWNAESFVVTNVVFHYRRGTDMRRTDPHSKAFIIKVDVVLFSMDDPIAK